MKILKTLFEVAETDGSRIALSSPFYEINYRELAAMVLECADRISKRGVKPSSLLVAYITNDVRSITVSLSSLLLGCRWIEATNAFARNKAKMSPFYLIHDDEEIESDTDSHIHVRNWNLTSSKAINRTRLAQYAGYSSLDDIAYITTSSGSTGKPKFIAVQYGAILQRLSWMRESWMTERPKLACLFSPASLIGYNTILTGLNWGGTVIFNPTFEMLIKEMPDQLTGSPVQITSLFKEKLNSKLTEKLPALRSTGGPITTKFVNKALNCFERVQNTYGSSEAGRISSKIIDTNQEGPISVGAPYPTAKVEIVDENGVRLPPLEEGIVRVKTVTMIDRYYIATPDQKDVFIDGWFYPGDRGYFDESGELNISGRSRETLNIGGSKIQPHAVDEALMAIDGIMDCVSFALPDEMGLNQLAAVIVLTDGHDIDSVVKRIFSDPIRVGNPMIPKQIFVADRTPRNANGKATRHLAEAFVSTLKPIRLYDILIDMIAQIEELKKQGLAD